MTSVDIPPARSMPSLEVSVLSCKSEVFVAVPVELQSERVERRKKKKEQKKMCTGIAKIYELQIVRQMTLGQQVTR